MPMSVLFVVSGGTGSRTVRSTASGLSVTLCVPVRSAQRLCRVLLQGVLGYPESGTGIFSQEGGLRGSVGLFWHICSAECSNNGIRSQIVARRRVRTTWRSLRWCIQRILRLSNLSFSALWRPRAVAFFMFLGLEQSSRLTMASRPFFGSRFLAKATSFISSQNRMLAEHAHLRHECSVFGCRHGGHCCSVSGLC